MTSDGDDDDTPPPRKDGRVGGRGKTTRWPALKYQKVETWTPLDAIQWCSQQSKRVRLGTNDYLEIVAVIRLMIKERSDLNKEIDKLEKEIERLTTPPPPKVRSPFHTEGKGQWDIPA